MVCIPIYDLQKVDGYHELHHIIRWHVNGLHDDEKMAGLSKTVFVQSTKGVHTDKHTHTQTLTNAIGKNEMRCISLKNQAIG